MEIESFSQQETSVAHNCKAPATPRNGSPLKRRQSPQARAYAPFPGSPTHSNSNNFASYSNGPNEGISIANLNINMNQINNVSSNNNNNKCDLNTMETVTTRDCNTSDDNSSNRSSSNDTQTTQCVEDSQPNLTLPPIFGNYHGYGSSSGSIFSRSGSSSNSMSSFLSNGSLNNMPPIGYPMGVNNTNNNNNNMNLNKNHVKGKSNVFNQNVNYGNNKSNQNQSLSIESNSGKSCKPIVIDDNDNDNSNPNHNNNNLNNNNNIKMAGKRRSSRLAAKQQNKNNDTDIDIIMKMSNNVETASNTNNTNNKDCLNNSGMINNTQTIPPPITITTTTTTGTINSYGLRCSNYDKFERFSNNIHNNGIFKIMYLHAGTKFFSNITGDSHHTRLIETKLNLTFDRKRRRGSEGLENFFAKRRSVNELTTGKIVGLMVIGDPEYYDEQIKYDDEWVCGPMMYKIVETLRLPEELAVPVIGFLGAFYVDQPAENEILRLDIVQEAIRDWRLKYGARLSCFLLFFFSFCFCFLPLSRVFGEPVVGYSPILLCGILVSVLLLPFFLFCFLFYLLLQPFFV